MFVDLAHLTDYSASNGIDIYISICSNKYTSWECIGLYRIISSANMRTVSLKESLRELLMQLVARALDVSPPTTT